MIAYICEQGAKIHREGERLVVRGKESERTLFTHKLKQLVLFGAIHLTAHARSLILAKNIDTVFLNSSGSYRGRLAPLEGENVFLRKRQYDLLNDKRFGLKIASEIVKAKLHNQGVMLSRLKREHHIPEADRGIEELKALAREAARSDNVDSLRGIEGSAAAIYFHYYSHAFDSSLHFCKRVRRPPTDPVNAVLSLVYTLLIDRCYTACRIAGLDPYPASLHALEYGRYSLPLDLVEEFRPVIGDTLTLSLFSRHGISLKDFETRISAPPSDRQDSASHAYALAAPALKKTLNAFQKKMKSQFHNRQSEKEMTYADALEWQARNYREAIENGADKYRPFLWH